MNNRWRIKTKHYKLNTLTKGILCLSPFSLDGIETSPFSDDFHDMEGRAKQITKQLKCIAEWSIEDQMAKKLNMDPNDLIGAKLTICCCSKY
jgi:hypothetical protein